MILISPYSRPLRNGKRNAKEYPYWSELVALLPGKVTQIGVPGEKPIAGAIYAELSLREVRIVVARCDYWIAVDNFLQHLAFQERKPGVVLWSKSDPLIFGYPENLNLLRDRKHLRARQFGIWEEQAYDAQAFMPATDVAREIAAWRASALAPGPQPP